MNCEAKYLKKYKAAQAGATSYAGVNYGVVKATEVKAKKTTNQNGNRTRIWALIGDAGRPITCAELSASMGLRASNVRAHVLAMVELGKVKEGGRSAPNGQSSAAYVLACDTYGHRADVERKKAAVVAAIAEFGPMARNEIARAANLPTTTIYSYLPQLMLEGKIKRIDRKDDPKGKSVVRYVVPEKSKAPPREG